MGLPIMSRGSVSALPSVVLGNPVNHRYEILDRETCGNGAVILKVRYPDCTNYEGEKILVYKSELELHGHLMSKNPTLDPHFLEGHCSPVARFEPTERGWIWALRFARTL